mmetsp:Transcript_19999/g.37128  ORF Transcript_19999/g.37128 Transcript_19999/m.37128 type:complete len:789 (+) Transcript_19999:3590-5956(+)
MRSGRPWPRRGRFKPKASEQCTDLVRQLKQRELECMICLNEIGRRGKIWNCEKCRKPFHLTCTQKWQQKLGGSWQCPACNSLYCHEPRYTCYCGKVEDPAHNPSLTPHSCGDVCGRRLGPSCPHKCTLLCHPGNCPPCTAMSQIQKCGCGKTTYQILCRDNIEQRTCQNVCERKLNCGRHTCPIACHVGECAPCDQRAISLCKCGKYEKEIRCGNPQPSCGKVCGKTLACGNHQCTQTCHKGPCRECELLPYKITTCFCGKQSLDLLLIEERKTCSDPMPSCFAPCGKARSCGHPCTTSCHKGECPPCNRSAEFTCRCGKEKRVLPCVQQNSFLCSNKCNKKLSCRRHRCEVECCPGFPDQHLCTQVCKKLLNCTRHTCINFCHIDSCELCPVVYRARISCPCGKTYKDPPTLCDKDTFVFNCHEVCNKPLDCGHLCASLCHDGPCPRCIALTDRPCNCRRETRKNVQCSLVSVSCGKVCKEKLPCNHLCEGRCHLGSCPDECRQPCTRKRLGCDHMCGVQCHSDRPCPQDQCNVKVHIFCPCGRRTELKKCYEHKAIECDDNCVRLERDEKLEAALDTASTPEEYTAELVEAARPNMTFIETLEKKVEEFIKGDRKLMFMPPMKAELRHIVHDLLRKYYFLDTESFDQEPKRSVIAYRSPKAKIPSKLLSEFIDDVDRGIAALKVKTVAASLLFYNLSRADTNESISDALSKYEDEFYIEWFNDHSAYAHFYSLPKAIEANRKLTSIPGPYAAVRLIQDGLPTSDPDYKRRFKNTRKKHNAESSTFD